MSSDPLDDFFAKKDRARNKTVKKSTGDKVKSEKSKKVEKDLTAIIAIKPLDNDDGEWKEIEEKKDNYEGLKIQSMTIKDKEEEIREKQKEKDAVEQEKRYEETGGPWKVPESEAGAPETAEVDPELSVGPPPSTIPVEEKKSSYVPPHMRNKASASDITPAPLGRSGRRTVAPVIESKAEFPELGTDPHDSEQERQPTAVASGPTINVGNKFSALTSNN